MKHLNDGSTTCPAGSYLDANGVCVGIVCPADAPWDANTQMCVPTDGSPAFPSGAQGGEVMVEKKPFYKNWKFWAALGGGIAIAGTGAYLVTRRY